MTASNEPKATLPRNGHRRQRSACGEYFNHVHDFDRHRVRKHIVRRRRCLSVGEMAAKNFSSNARGFWITEAQAAARIASARQGHLPTWQTESLGST
jgi:hypothetical protein